MSPSSRLRPAGLLLVALLLLLGSTVDAVFQHKASVDDSPGPDRCLCSSPKVTTSGCCVPAGKGRTLLVFILFPGCLQGSASGGPGAGLLGADR